jgi:hypothetical protein
MRTYNQVFNQSKKEVLDQRKAVFEKQKIAVVNVLKENYCIDGKIDDLPKEEKEKMLKRLLEYWSPKTGINDRGVKLIQESIIVLSENSTADDVRAYIRKRAYRNAQQMIECFRAGRQDLIVEMFNEEVKPLMGKPLKDKFIINTVWDVVSRRIKNGN